MRSVPIALSILGGVAVTTDAVSPWLPDPGSGEVVVTHTVETFDEFYMGTEKARGPGVTDPGIDQVTTTLDAVYGLRPGLAADLTFGHTRTSIADLDVASGFTDVRLGLRIQLLDELAFDFDENDDPVDPPPLTLSARIGAVVGGTYDVLTDAPHSPGDGASGAEVSLLAGKIWGHHSFGWASGEVGYAFRAAEVPDDVVVAVSTGWRHPAGLAVAVGIRHVQGLGGSDVGDPGFVFQELREIASTAETNVSWSFASGPFVGAGLARTLSGRNTGDKLVARVSMGTTF